MKKKKAVREAIAIIIAEEGEEDKIINDLYKNKIFFYRGNEGCFGTCFIRRVVFLRFVATCRWN